MALYTSYYTKQLALRPEAGHTLDVQAEGERKIQSSVARRTIDLAGCYINWFEKRSLIRHPRDVPVLDATPASALRLLPPFAYAHQPASSFAIKYIQNAERKTRSSINVVVWTPDGRRCLTGTQGGEFTMFGSQAFQFETIIQAHEQPVRSMVFTHNGNFLVSGDDSGLVRYWKPNLELVKSVQAHREAVRQVSFSPTDLKYATASDDSTIKVWDFARCTTEQICAGHGGDVKCVDWHPAKSLLVSASKDGLVKLWCPKSGKSLGTMHGHKGTIMTAQWNLNGNWVLTASRDQTCKVYDVRVQRELATFTGHNRDVTAASWHPLHEELFVSGGYDGSLLFWLAGRQAPQSECRGAHGGSVWGTAWHPSGHLLATGASDGGTSFWCRCRPGDPFFEMQRAQQDELAAMSAAADEATARQQQAQQAQQQPLLFGQDIPGGAIPGIGEAISTPVVLAPPPRPVVAVAQLDIFAIPEPAEDVDASLAKAGGEGALLPEEQGGGTPMRAGSRAPPMRSGSSRRREEQRQPYPSDSSNSRKRSWEEGAPPGGFAREPRGEGRGRGPPPERGRPGRAVDPHKRSRVGPREGEGGPERRGSWRGEDRGGGGPGGGREWRGKAGDGRQAPVEPRAMRPQTLAPGGGGTGGGTAPGGAPLGTLPGQGPIVLPPGLPPGAIIIIPQQQPPPQHQQLPPQQQGPPGRGGRGRASRGPFRGGRGGRWDGGERGRGRGGTRGGGRPPPRERDRS